MLVHEEGGGVRFDSVTSTFMLHARVIAGLKEHAPGLVADLRQRSFG